MLIIIYGDNTIDPIKQQHELFVGGPMVIFKWKAAPGWPVEYVSPNVRDQFGYQPDDLTSGKILYAGIIHPDDLPRVTEEVTNFSNSGVAYFEQEYRIARADGVYRWLFDYTSAVRDSHGVITHYHGYVLDITSRIESENAILQAAKKLRNLYDNMRDAFAVVEMSGRLVELNNEFTNMLGYSQEDITKLNYSDITPEKWHAIEAKIINEQVIERGYSDVYEKEYIRSDGSVIAVELRTSLIRDDSGKPAAMWAIVRDITRRKKAQERFAKLSRLKEQLLLPGSLSEKLKRVTDGTVEILDADFARVWVIEKGDICRQGCINAPMCPDRSRCLHLYASSGRYTRINGEHRRVPLGAFKIGRIASGEYTMFITNDVTNDPQVHDHDWARKLGLVSFAGYRLVSSEGGPVGVIAIFSKHVIGPDEQFLLEDIANTASHVVLTGLTEKSLREEQDKAKDYFNVAGVIMLVLAPDQTVIQINQKGCEVLGYSKDEIIGKNWLDTAVPEYLRDSVQAVFNELLVGNAASAERFENQIVTKGGEERVIDWRNTVIRDEYGKTVSIISSGEDITDRKKAEEAIRASQANYKAIFDSANDAIFVHDIDTGKILDVNHKMIEMFGYTSDEARQIDIQTFSEGKPPYSQQDALQRVRKAALGEPQLFEWKAKNKAGRTFWVEVNLKRASIGGQHRILAIVRDITERKRAEEAIKAQANEWQWLMKSMASPFAIFESVFDENKRLVDARFWYFNDAYAHLAKIELENVRGKSVSDIWAGIEPEWFENLGEVAVTGKSKSFEAYFGPIKTYFACTAYRPWDSPQRFCAIYEDITERKKTEEDLNQYNRMLQILSACNQALVRITNENTLLREICRHIVEIGGYPIAWVGYAQQDEARTVSVVARSSLGGDDLDDRKISWADDEYGRGPTGTAIRLDRPCVLNQRPATAQLDPWQMYAVRHGYISAIAIPLHSNGRVLGALTVFTSIPDAFHEKEVKLLTELANDLEYGIASLRIRDERAKAMADLKESEAKLHSIFRTSPVGIGLAQNRIISYINEKFAATIGYAPSELLGKSTRIFYCSDMDFENAGQSLYDQVRQSGVGVIETKFMSRDGRVIDVVVAVSAIDPADPYNVVFTVMDVSSRKRLELEREQLIQSLAAKNEELESIIYVGSHDLKSPQVNVQGFAMELINACSNLKKLVIDCNIPPERNNLITQVIDAEIPTCVEFISSGVKKMGTILDGLMEISRLGRIDVRLEHVDIDAAVKSVLQAVEYRIKSKNIAVEVASLPECVADRVQIADVFFQLVDNAISYLDPSRPGIIRITAKLKDQTAVYCVEDNGIGIRENYFQHIFEPFHKLDPSRTPGPGLGLAIAKRIINRLNGKIWVESVYGQWTRFCIELPTTP
ncbi:MAG: hypothetical protein A2Y07_10890 [Planctomycetes bacterium GWF2_50_10]|nr:MAG: hypothetical protein A2Y07_10890 [Planctomycetes bacterium GWF2_50_10]